ncbi:NF038122 family metalloprotease [Phenylobacterium sp.]|uniref:NF038122 family metalloprotease n=1 Tax=Phenylobacterium sp. TaxID=1871053 RepID=UPI00286C1729|nr:NF038122 family metalloprotease [Phenylobacterium sp.]
MNKLLMSAAMTLTMGVMATPASSATIVLNDLGGVGAGSQALQGFGIAAEFWASRLTNNVTVNLDVSFRSLDAGVLGQAGSRSFVVDVETIQSQIAAVGTSSLDAIAAANLPPLTLGEYGVGALSVYTPGALYAGGLGADALSKVLDNDGGGNNSFLDANSANLKALGFTGFGDVADGTIQFSSDFKFDFDPSDGIAGDSIDFISVAIHEIGHILGFVSGVDTYDILGYPNGVLWNDPDFGALPLGDFAIGSVLDLYRYSAGNAGTALDWTVGGTPFFSIDGESAYGGGFSTGAFNGDGRQASHWKDNIVGMPQLGALDPTVAYGQMGRVTSLDLAAFDAIGWNVDYDVLNSGRSFSTRDIYFAAIPEPTTWALTIIGFFVMGASLRANRRRPAFARA